MGAGNTGAFRALWGGCIDQRLWPGIVRVRGGLGVVGVPGGVVPGVAVGRVGRGPCRRAVRAAGPRRVGGAGLGRLVVLARAGWWFAVRARGAATCRRWSMRAGHVGAFRAGGVGASTNVCGGDLVCRGSPAVVGCCARRGCRSSGSGCRAGCGFAVRAWGRGGPVDGGRCVPGMSVHFGLAAWVHRPMSVAGDLVRLAEAPLSLGGRPSVECVGHRAGWRFAMPDTAMVGGSRCRAPRPGWRLTMPARQPVGVGR
jgi:hypothetical protein